MTLRHLTAAAMAGAAAFVTPALAQDVTADVDYVARNDGGLLLASQDGGCLFHLSRWWWR